MNISKRLNRLAEMVTEGSRLADVGTDHGYVPLCLCRQGKIPGAVAMDINEGPLLRARQHIDEAKLGAYIETRLSDGLAALKADEADTVLIAGMGGQLMERILEQGGHVLPTVKELVLQPQSEIWRVRRWLFAHGFRIVCEDILVEDGKFYPMFRAVRKGTAAKDEGDTEEAYTEEEYRFGKWSLQRSKKTLLLFLEKRLEVTQMILSGLPKGEEPKVFRRREELKREEALLWQMLCEGRREERVREENQGGDEEAL